MENDKVERFWDTVYNANSLVDNEANTHAPANAMSDVVVNRHQYSLPPI